MMKQSLGASSLRCSGNTISKRLNAGVNLDAHTKGHQWYRLSKIRGQDRRRRICSAVMCEKLLACLE
jgi:GH24 family phage-related lysozyme (muramidase)